MPHRLREDAPGLLHHVYNRGIARRTVFERRRDVRKFLSLLACEARAGRIEVLAFSILTTHYHLVIRSRTGELPAVMQRVVNQYVRYFNRTRKRDGPLFRSRYQSKPILSERYLWTLIRYVDQNAVQARLADSGTTYRYGSAALYVGARRPRWLSTDVLDEMMGSPDERERLPAYLRAFGGSLSSREERLIERRLTSRSTATDDWDDLIDAAPDRVVEWMRTKARLADGSKPGLPFVDAGRVDEAIEVLRNQRGALSETIGTRKRDVWPVARMGLLRDVAGMTVAEVARHCERGRSTVVRRLEQHVRLLASSDAYAEVVAEAAACCLRG